MKNEGIKIQKVGICYVKFDLELLIEKPMNNLVIHEIHCMSLEVIESQHLFYFYVNTKVLRFFPRF